LITSGKSYFFIIFTSFFGYTPWTNKSAVLDLNYLFNGIIVGFTASVPLGPMGVLIMQRTLNKGKISGFFSGLGAATADTFYAIIAGFSLSYVINFIVAQQLYFQIIGSGLLIYLGVKIFYTNPAKQLRKQLRQGNNLFKDFISVYLITISNPFALVLFGAVFAGFGMIKKETDFYATVLIVIGVLVGASLWWFILTTIVSLFRKKFKLKRLWWINKITGAIIVILGILVIIKLFIYPELNYDQ